MCQEKNTIIKLSFHFKKIIKLAFMVDGDNLIFTDTY